MERGNFPPLPAPSSPVCFLEGPLTTHYSWALAVAVGEKRCPFDCLLHGKKQGRGGQRGWEERSAPSAHCRHIAGIPSVLPWLCRDGAACASSQGRSVTQLPRCEMPSYPGDASGKTWRGNGIEGGHAVEKLLGEWELEQELWMVGTVGESPPGARAAPG